MNTAFTNTIVGREPRDTLSFVLPIMDDITNLHCIQLSHSYTIIAVEIISGYNIQTPHGVALNTRHMKIRRKLDSDSKPNYELL